MKHNISLIQHLIGALQVAVMGTLVLYSWSASLWLIVHDSPRNSIGYRIDRLSAA